MRKRNDFESIVSLVKRRFGFPGNLYKFNPIRRRIEYCMNRLGLSDPADYLKVLEESEDELNHLMVELTINLSYFFRNPETFSSFEKICLPQILKSKNIAFWSAGCAAGEEPYSIAIILQKHGVDNARILGTDIDSKAITRAKNAVYNQFAVQFIGEELIKKYFTYEEKQYVLSPQIVSMVDFKVANVFNVNYENSFDAVFLRNLLIYLSKNAQIDLLQIVKRSLRPGGFLVLGKVETMIGIDPENLFTPIDLKERIFQLR